MSEKEEKDKSEKLEDKLAKMREKGATLPVISGDREPRLINIPHGRLARQLIKKAGTTGLSRKDRAILRRMGLIR